MQKKNSNVARKAWNLMRLAFIWARKGGVFKRRLLMELRLVPKFMKSLGHSTPRGQLHYGEHELSFNETPIIHVKMHRPASLRFLHFSCTSPQVDFDYEFGNDDDDEGFGYDDRQKNSKYNGDELELEDDNGFADEDRDEEEDEEIDLRAEKFIAKFYEQMRLQRQISYLQYNQSSN